MVPVNTGISKASSRYFLREKYLLHLPLNHTMQLYILNLTLFSLSFIMYTIPPAVEVEMSISI